MSASAPTGHRERLLGALAASIEAKGFADTTVADVVRLARTSRRTFYEHFSDRQACFLALFDESTTDLAARTAAAVASDQEWAVQVERALGAYLSGVAAQPALFESFARELPALGEAGAARQRQALERFAWLLVDLVQAGAERQPETVACPLTIDLAVIIVGGLRELTLIAVREGRPLEELLPIASRAVRGILGAAVLSSPEAAAALQQPSPQRRSRLTQSA